MNMEELKEKFDNSDWVNLDWTDLVLEQLAPNEIATDPKGKKYPRVRGLRRVGSFLAPNTHMNCEVISCNESYAACKAIALNESRPEGMNYTLESIHASSMADAHANNVGHPEIAKHLLATAESRAEGRCWTKILKLNCLTAEEMSLGVAEATKNDAKDIDSEEGDIVDTQKRMINKKCKDMNINPLKYAEKACEKLNLDVKSNIKRNTVSKNLAAGMIKLLDKAAREELEVPEEFKGYVAL